IRRSAQNYLKGGKTVKDRALFKLLLVLGLVALLSVPFAGCAPEAAPEPQAEPEEETPVTKIVWRLNSNFIPEGIPGRSYDYFAEILESLSDGNFVIEAYYNASLGYSATESLSTVHQGLVDLTEISPSANGEEAIVSLGEMPFVWENEQVHKYFCFEEYWPAAQKVFDRNGWDVTIFGFYFNPSPVYFFSKDPLRVMDDWQGLKLRCWGGVVADAMDVIGTDPYVISTSELYTALQRGLVNAAITSYMSATETHFWEVLNYINKVPVNRGTWLMGVNTQALEALPSEMQDVFWESAEAYNKYTTVENLISYRPLEQLLLEGGMEIVLPEEDVMGKMKQRMVDADFYRIQAEKMGPEAVELLIKWGALD
ncbi:TRAP transporter substrate-binding protein, partial [Chloroflexota bacterium]